MFAGACGQRFPRTAQTQGAQIPGLWLPEEGQAFFSLIQVQTTIALWCGRSLGDLPGSFAASTCPPLLVLTEGGEIPSLGRWALFPECLIQRH
jgi:hypothetical protein